MSRSWIIGLSSALAVLVVVALWGARFGRRDERALIRASIAGDLGAVEALLSTGVDVDAQVAVQAWPGPIPFEVWRSTALIEAAAAGHAEIVDALLAAGADPALTQSRIGWFGLVEESAPPEIRHSAFTRSASRGHEAVLAKLLSYRVPRHVLDTALRWAAFDGQAATTGLLLEAGADPDSRGRGGTPLMLAAGATPRNAPGRDSVETVRLLIDGGASVDTSIDGETALGKALLAGNSAVVDLLTAAGASYRTSALGTAGPSLIEAAAAGNLELVRELIRAGVDLDATESVRTTGAMRHSIPGPATIAALSRGDGHPEIAIELIEAGADVDAQDSSGRTLLMAACFGRRSSPGERELVDAILAAGPDLSIEDDSGRTALDVARDFGNRFCSSRLRAADVG